MITHFGRFPSQGPEIMRTSAALCVLAGLLVVHRVWQALHMRKSLGWQDYNSLASLAFLIVITAIAFEACLNGFGMHRQDISKAGGNAMQALFYFYLFQIFYKIVICFNKCAFLTLYLHLFPQRFVKRICYATVALVATGTAVFVIATIFECMPVAYNWNKNVHGGHCIDNAAFRWSWAAFNTSTDIWICALPMPILFRLEMSLMRRLVAMFMFALGFFIVATSIVRIIMLVESVTASDPPWQSAPAFLWSHVEASLGLIAACLPSLKPTLSALLPLRGLWSTLRNEDSGFRPIELQGNSAGARSGAAAAPGSGTATSELQRKMHHGGNGSVRISSGGDMATRHRRASDAYTFDGDDEDDEDVERRLGPGIKIKQEIIVEEREDRGR